MQFRQPSIWPIRISHPVLSTFTCSWLRHVRTWWLHRDSRIVFCDAIGIVERELWPSDTPIGSLVLGFKFQVSRKGFKLNMNGSLPWFWPPLFSCPFSRLNLWPTSVLTYDWPLSLLKTALNHQLAFVLNHAAKIQLFSPRRAVFPKSETAFPWERAFGMFWVVLSSSNGSEWY